MPIRIFNARWWNAIAPHSLQMCCSCCLFPVYLFFNSFFSVSPPVFCFVLSRFFICFPIRRGKSGFLYGLGHPSTWPHAFTSHTSYIYIHKEKISFKWTYYTNSFQSGAKVKDKVFSLEFFKLIKVFGFFCFAWAYNGIRDSYTTLCWGFSVKWYLTIG